MRLQTLILAIATIWLWQVPACSEDSRQQATFFENRIRPLLAKHCWDCHGSDDQESGLRLDSLQAVVRGGVRGPAVVPGDAKNSLLLHAINHSEPDLQMPEGDKLSAAEINVFKRWIDEGAYWPGQVVEPRKTPSLEGPLFTEEEKRFWAFVPPQRPHMPRVHDDWIQSPVDSFVLARLESAGLKPAPPASKRELVRRTYFDLTGLPPTPDQAAAFLQDDSPQAFERLVDRLLASPSYGERWGRHWLDVARYADSNGLDENWAFEYIFKYRDWVIRAFNRDLPYTSFVTHQLAGDLLPQQAGETQADYMQRVAATGFLALGPKMIADDDPKKKKMDIVDEQLSTVCQTFMALTVGCARCHDHKFDPIPTWDYYAMAGIFKSTRTMEHLRVVAPVWLHEFRPDGFDEELAKYEQQHQELVRARNDFWKAVASQAYHAEKPDQAGKQGESEAKGDDKEKAEQAFELPKNAERWVPEEQRERWKELQETLHQHEKTKPTPIKVMAPTEGEAEDLRVSVRGNYLTLGSHTRRQFLRIIDGEQPKPIETQQSGRLELAHWLTQEKHPLTARVIVNRVWRWRFGQGIVPTTDNFGRLGESPTHPELLDWLAVQLMEDGWSIKKLHKRMMLSSTYQMSTRYDEQAADVDPQNRLWWRFPRKRLEAEAIRDTILFVSGSLDFRMFGSLMTLKDRSYVTGTASKSQKYNNPRRSLYQPVYRSAVYDILTAFDFPDPATPQGDRSSSVIAPQALVMMNSPLVSESAGRLAEGLLKDNATDTQRVHRLYEMTISRSPTAEECSAMLAYLERMRQLYEGQGDGEDKARHRSWQSLCRTLISSNEFLYVD